MKKTIQALSAAVVAAGMGTAASAAVVDLVGDKDCFGTGDVCAEGVAPFPYTDVTPGVGDVAPFDHWNITSSTQSWTHSYAAGAYSSASLALRTIGIGDVAGPYDVFVDGTKVGEIPYDGFGHLIIETFTFSGAGVMALLNDGSATVSFTPSSTDGWSIDYSELTLNMSAIPVPASLPLLGGALLFGGWVARRRRKG